MKQCIASSKSLRKTDKTIYCGKWKPLSDFYPTQNGKYRGQCKQCFSNQTKLFYEIDENRQRRNLSSKKYAEDHKEENRKRAKTYAATHKEEKKNYDKYYNDINKEKIKQNKKEYNIQNKEHLKEKKKIYVEENRKEIYEYQNSYKKERRQKDPIFRFREIVSSQVRIKLQSTGISKNHQSIKDHLLDDEWFENIWTKLEALFSLPSNLTKDGKVWMTRYNWGLYNSNLWDDNDPSTWTWQVDHIIPHSSFNYIDMDCDAFKECWSIENLRPLNAKININENKFRTAEQILQIKKEINEFLK